MPEYLLDTNVLLYLLRDDTRGQFVRTKYSLSSTLTEARICVVTAGEVLAIAFRRNWGEKKREKLQQLLESIMQFDIAYWKVLKN